MGVHVRPDPWIYPPENGWLEYDRFLFGMAKFLGAMLVSGSVWCKTPKEYFETNHFSLSAYEKSLFNEHVRTSCGGHPMSHQCSNAEPKSPGGVWRFWRLLAYLSVRTPGQTSVIFVATKILKGAGANLKNWNINLNLCKALCQFDFVKG